MSFTGGRVLVCSKDSCPVQVLPAAREPRAAQCAGDVLIQNVQQFTLQFLYSHVHHTHKNVD